MNYLPQWKLSTDAFNMFSQTRLKATRGDSPDSYDGLTDSESVQRDASTAKDKDSDTGSASNSENEKHAHGQEKEENEDNAEPYISPPPENAVRSISFGALARAQASLLGGNRKKRERPSTGTLPSHTSSHSGDINDHSAEALERKAGKKDDRKHTRLSKHAPAELSSKKAVSRKRSVVPVPKRDVRDPRFESALGPVNGQKVKSNYAFLEEYRDSELRLLKAAIRRSKTEDEKETLKKEVLRMESRKEARQRKDAEQEVLRRHRKEERAKVEGGKAPFYLKKADVRKEALIDRYRQMKGKEIDKLVERRRKKKASREKRNMPKERRVNAR